MTAFLTMLGLGKKPATAVRSMLPALNSFIACEIRGGPSGQVCFEAASGKTIKTSVLDGMKTGQKVIFNYEKANGKYTFTSTVAAVTGGFASFTMPARINMVRKVAAAHGRRGVRTAASTRLQWRFTPGGSERTDYQSGSLADISQGGASLNPGQTLQIGAKLDLKVAFSEKGTPVVIHAEVRRVSKTPNGKFVAGLQFVQITPAIDRAIFEFINRRQTDRRSRGLG